MLAKLQLPVSAVKSAPRTDARHIRTLRLESWHDLPDLECAWSALLNRTGRHSVFQTFPWHVSWWKAFGAPHELLVILGFAGARLVAVAPMMVCRPGPLRAGRGQVRFIGSLNHAADFCDFIVDPDVPEALDALLDNLCAGPAPFSRIDLSHFPTHSPNLQRALRNFKAAGLHAACDFVMDAPVRILGNRQADLKAAGKQSLKRHLAWFRKAGELRFVRCANAAEILGYLDAFFVQHEQRWGRTATPSQFRDPAQRQFYRDLVHKLHPLGWLRFDVVLFNSAPLAFHFGFEYRGSFIWYKSSFDVNYAFKSPGEVLLKFLLDAAIEGGLEEFDFTVGAEAYKYRFATRVRSISRLRAFRSAAEFWAWRGARQAKALARKLLKRAKAAQPLPQPAPPISVAPPPAAPVPVGAGDAVAEESRAA